MVFRRRAFRIAAVVVGAPTILGAGMLGYVAFRVKTKPLEHNFQPLVDRDGHLQLKDCVIHPPTTVRLVMRVLTLLWIFLPVALSYLWLLIRGKTDERYKRWLQQLLDAVERGGPALIKAGQWACTRHDMFSETFRNTFCKLYCEVRTHPYQDTARVIEEDLKQPLSSVFSTFSEGTIGSGSIGQVHEAVLKATNERVVVKVMHPSIVETIALDFYLVNKLANLTHYYFPHLEMYDFPSLAFAWTNHLAAQLDFRIECEHLELFRKHFEGTEYVSFPRPIFATQRVLVETFATGSPATPEFLRSHKDHVRDILATKGLNAWCKMLLRDNFIHGDMHPGNILVDASDAHAPKITLIDVGLCQKLNAEEAKVVNQLVGSFVRWKSSECCDAIESMSETSHKYANLPQFHIDMQNLFEKYRPLKYTEDQVVTNILEACFGAVRDNRVTMDPPYVSLLFAVLVLESFVMALNPEFNMVRSSAPWLVSEGHVSTDLMRNLFLSTVDHGKQQYKVVRGRVNDWWNPPLQLGDHVRMAK